MKPISLLIIGAGSRGRTYARKTTIFATRSTLTGDGRRIEHFDFLTEKREVFDTSAEDASSATGHGGGDFHLVRCFMDAIADNKPSLILTGPAEALATHLTIFAGEKARR